MGSNPTHVTCAGTYKENNRMEPNGHVIPHLPSSRKSSASTGGSEEKSGTLSHSDCGQEGASLSIGGQVGRDAPDGKGGERRKGKGSKRPLSGYELPEISSMCELLSDLGHEDDRYIHCWKCLLSSVYTYIAASRYIHVYMYACSVV